MKGLNDQDRFRQDLIALLPRLRRFARTLTRSTADADDVVQEACVKALARYHQWDPAQPLDGWVFRIARNHWFSELRKRQVRTGQGQVDAADTPELSVAPEGEARLAAAEVENHVSALPADLSTVLLLVCAEGYSYKEAASLLDIPIGTVMSRIYRARKILSTSLRDKEHVAT